MRTKEAIRKYCVWCCGDDPRGVKDCTAQKCPLWNHKDGKSGTVKDIRKRCVDCSGYSMKSVKNCYAKDCPLYPFRLGTNPERLSNGGSPNTRR